MPKKLDIAIDLETLSVSREHLPAVVEIGAVSFDRDRPADECVTGWLTTSQPMHAAERHGYSDTDTRDWLARERPDRFGDQHHAPGTWSMLGMLKAWLHNAGIKRPEDANWWAWGAEYDLRILQGLIERLDFGAVPIHYRNVRDARTYCTELSEQFRIRLPEQAPGTKHHAVKDAYHCARLVTGVYQQMEVIRELAEGREVVA